MGTGMKIGINIALIVLTIIIGLFLHKTGKPYSTVMLTLHKLATVAFAVFITLMLAHFLKTASPGTLMTTMVLAAAVSLALLLVSGGLLSVGKLDQIMLPVHRIATGGFVVSAGVMFWQLLVP